MGGVTLVISTQFDVSTNMSNVYLHAQICIYNNMISYSDTTQAFVKRIIGDVIRLIIKLRIVIEQHFSFYII